MKMKEDFLFLNFLKKTIEIITNKEADTAIIPMIDNGY